MIHFQYPGTREELVDNVLPVLAWMVTGRAAYEQSGLDRWSIDPQGNNWWVSLDGDRLSITYRYPYHGAAHCPERCLGVLLARMWKRLEPKR